MSNCIQWNLSYLFSGNASVKHLTTTEDTGSPRLIYEEREDEEKKITPYFKTQTTNNDQTSK